MKTIGIIVAVVVVFGGLLWWAGSASQPALVFVEDTNVACLPNGHQGLATHIHPTLSITVDGEPERLPANIGVSGNCMAETHTHDSSGTLHIETATHARLQELSIADFFDVWNQPVEREGYDMTISVNGQEVSHISDVPLQDQARIELTYTTQSET